MIRQIAWLFVAGGILVGCSSAPLEEGREQPVPTAASATQALSPARLTLRPTSDLHELARVTLEGEEHGWYQWADGLVIDVHTSDAAEPHKLPRSAVEAWRILSSEPVPRSLLDLHPILEGPSGGDTHVVQIPSNTITDGIKNIATPGTGPSGPTLTHECFPFCLAPARCAFGWFSEQNADLQAMCLTGAVGFTDLANPGGNLAYFCDHRFVGPGSIFGATNIFWDDGYTCTYTGASADLGLQMLRNDVGLQGTFSIAAFGTFFQWRVVDNCSIFDPFCQRRHWFQTNIVGTSGSVLRAEDIKY